MGCCSAARRRAPSPKETFVGGPSLSLEAGGSSRLLSSSHREQVIVVVTPVQSTWWTPALQRDHGNWLCFFCTFFFFLGDLLWSMRMKSEWSSGRWISATDLQPEGGGPFFFWPSILFSQVYQCLEQDLCYQVIILLVLKKSYHSFKIQGHLSKNLFYESWKHTNLAWSAVQMSVRESQTADNVQHICWYVWSSYKLKREVSLHLQLMNTITRKWSPFVLYGRILLQQKDLRAWALIDTTLQLCCMIEACTSKKLQHNSKSTISELLYCSWKHNQWFFYHALTQCDG